MLICTGIFNDAACWISKIKRPLRLELTSLQLQCVHMVKKYSNDGQ